jgi:hypothetical protein
MTSNTWRRAAAARVLVAAALAAGASAVPTVLPKLPWDFVPLDTTGLDMYADPNYPPMVVSSRYIPSEDVVLVADSTAVTAWMRTDGLLVGEAWQIGVPMLLGPDMYGWWDNTYIYAATFNVPTNKKWGVYCLRVDPGTPVLEWTSYVSQGQAAVADTPFADSGLPVHGKFHCGAQRAARARSPCARHPAVH